MRNSIVRASILVLGAGFVLSAVGCQMPQLKDQIADQERMIRQLRTEKASVEQQLKSKDAELADARRSAESANGRAGSLEAEVARLRDESERNRSSNGDLDNKRDEIQRVLGSDGDVDIRGGDIVITLPNRVTFASGSSNLSSKGQGLLDRLVSVLRADYASNPISIEGHTDDDPIKKSKFKTNWRLSVERAMSVRDHLERNGQINADRFRVVGYGQHRPVATNGNQNGKQQNRRVEIVILAT